MSVMLRLSRQGAKKNPQFLIVATDKNNKRDGAYLDRIGFYFPKEKDTKKKIKIDADKLAGWLKKGAIPSQTVGQLLNNLSN